MPETTDELIAEGLLHSECGKVFRVGKDKALHGDFRTKRVILEMYDAMAEAGRTGVPYQTRLDSPPADPRVAHHEVIEER